MRCSFSGLPVPTDKLFVLYYPPAAAHEAWDKSFYAAARAREALAVARDNLQSFFPRFVVTSKVWPGAAALLAAIALLAYWGAAAVPDWSETGAFLRWAPPAAALVLGLIGISRLRAFRERLGIWRGGCKQAVADELDAINRIMADLPEDPDAEEAAAIMRRECPDEVSGIAFFGANFKAFTYMDFILSPKLKHPADAAELPQMHSLYRDAYYVGEVVYDNWRMFHKDRRTPADPRFAGSGGRRGVI